MNKNYESMKHNYNSVDYLLRLPLILYIVFAFTPHTIALHAMHYAKPNTYISVCAFSVKTDEMR